jgi:TonB family protein
MKARTIGLAVALGCLDPLTLAAEGPALRAWVEVPAPKKINAPMPAYPPIAREARVQCLIVAQVIVGEDGQPRDVRLLTHVPLFDEAILKVVPKWRYEPTMYDGSARPVAVHEVFPFFLSKPKTADVMDVVQTHSKSPGLLEIKLWAVATILDRVSSEKEAATKALQAFAADSEPTVAKLAGVALQMAESKSGSR